MNDLMTNPAFKAYALSTVVLALNLLFLGGFTGAQRGKHKSPVTPEDRPDQGVLPVEHPSVARVLRAHRNAVESIVPYFALGLVYVLSGATGRGAAIYFGVFTTARVLHTVSYLLEKQPWRTIFFAVGNLCLVGMMVQIVMKAL